MGVIGMGLVLSGVAGVFLSLFYLIIPSSRGLAAEREEKGELPLWEKWLGHRGRLKKWNLTEGQYNTIYRTWKGRYTTSPTRLLRLVARRHETFIKSNPELEYVTLEDVLRLVVAKLPNPKPENTYLGDLLDGLFYKNWVDSRLRDFCVGGAWLPPHERPTHVVPSPLSTYNPETKKDLPFDALVFGTLTRSEKYAYTFDITQSCCFNLILSTNDTLTPTQMEHFWTALQPLKHPVSFEILGDGTKNAVVFQLLCHADDKTRVYNQLAALFPDSSINPEGSDEDFLIAQTEAPPRFLDNFAAHGISFGLGSHFTYPIRAWTSYDKTDPLGSFLNLLSDIPQDGGAVIQALICPLKNWEEDFKGIREIKERDKGDEHGYKKCPVEQKRRYPLFAVSLRSMSFFKKKKPAHHNPHTFSESVEQAMQAFRLADGNCITSQPLELLNAKETRRVIAIEPSKSPEGGAVEVSVPLTIPKLYATISPQLSEQELEAVLTRNTYRTGFILNTQELASLCHFPHAALQNPKLVRQDSTFAKAPEHLTKGQGLLIGINEVFGQSKEVYVPEDLRFRHMYVVGKTGMGKTAFLYNMIKNDIEAGKGVGLIPRRPHGRRDSL